MAFESSADAEWLKPPSSTLGLHQVYPDRRIKSNPSLDVVFVHGLGGDSYSTWSGSKGLWIRDLLPKSPFYEDARIFTFGYDARAFLRPFSKSTRGRTFTFAEALLSDLRDKRISPAAKKRPIVFLGHSLGGIVIKAALRHAHALESLYGDILEATKAIVFFGTPHQGADAAAWAAMLGGLGKIIGVQSTEVVEELKRWSDPLVELTTTFSELLARFDITTYCETKKINGILVVPQGSAKLGHKNEQSRDLVGNHREICKFTEDDPNWHIVIGRLEAVVERIQMSNEITLPEVPDSYRSTEAGAVVDQDDEKLASRFKQLSKTSHY
ncbi:hypothetical protein F4801DRAFT_528534 [Xylaria longipes]|nr:hypothetical protein F4801DRAFT_528534 [Xylaria longipes]